MDMKLHQLRYFIAVAEEGSFCQAAKRLHMTQPPLSRAVQQLEQAVDSRLLDRTTRRVTLTTAGAAMLDEARAIIARLDHAVTKVRRVDRGIAGTLTIGLSPGCHAWALPDLITPFKRSHPSVDVATRDASSAEQLGLLDTGVIDIGLICLPTAGGDHLTVTPIHRDHFAVWLPASHWLASRASIALPDLRGERLLAMSRQLVAPVHDEIAGRCHDAGVDLHADPTITSVAALVGVLASHPAPALIPSTFAPLAAGIGGRLVDLQDPPHLVTAAALPAKSSNTAAHTFLRTAQRTRSGTSQHPRAHQRPAAADGLHHQAA